MFLFFGLGSAVKLAILCITDYYCRPLPSSSFRNSFGFGRKLSLSSGDRDGGVEAVNNHKNSSSKVQRFLEKGKVNLARSKSELGEQHRRIVAQLSRGRVEMSEQNRKFISSLAHGMEKGKKGVRSRLHLSANRVKSAQDQSEENGVKINSARDVDQILLDLGINPNFTPRAQGGQGRNTLVHRTSVEDNGVTALEQRLVDAHGDLDFIDDRELTLTRSYPLAAAEEENLTKQIFQELSKSGTFTRRNNNSSFFDEDDFFSDKEVEDEEEYNGASTIIRKRPVIPKSNLSSSTRSVYLASMSSNPPSSIVSHPSDIYATTSRSKMAKRRERRLSSSSYSGETSCISTFDSTNASKTLDDDDDDPEARFNRYILNDWHQI